MSTIGIHRRIFFIRRLLSVQRNLLTVTHHSNKVYDTKTNKQYVQYEHCHVLYTQKTRNTFPWFVHQTKKRVCLQFFFFLFFSTLDLAYKTNPMFKFVYVPFSQPYQLFVVLLYKSFHFYIHDCFLFYYNERIIYIFFFFVVVWWWHNQQKRTKKKIIKK